MGSARTPMPCCYSDIYVAVFSEKAMDHPFKSLISKRSFGDGLHCGFTVMNMYIIIWNISAPLMHQVRLDLLCQFKMKMALNFWTLDTD